MRASPYLIRSLEALYVEVSATTGGYKADFLQKFFQIQGGDKIAAGSQKTAIFPPFPFLAMFNG